MIKNYLLPETHEQLQELFVFLYILIEEYYQDDLAIVKTTINSGIPEDIKDEFELLASLVIALYSLIKDLRNFDNYHRFRAIMAITEIELEFLRISKTF